MVNVVLNKISQFFLLCLLIISFHSQAITIQVINQSVNVDFSASDNRTVTVPVYQVQVGNHTGVSLPHKLNFNELVEEGYNKVRISFLGFEEGYSGWGPPSEWQERVFRLLTRNPDTLLDQQMTCIQFCRYLKTGITLQRYNPPQISLIDRDYKIGDVVAMEDSKRELIHMALYVGQGVFMSKFGNYGIHFHSREATDVLYGPDLDIKPINFKETEPFWHMKPLPEDLMQDKNPFKKHLMPSGLKHTGQMQTYMNLVARSYADRARELWLNPTVVKNLLAVVAYGIS